MAKIPSTDTKAKISKSLSVEALQGWLVAAEMESGNVIVPGSFRWKYGSRTVGRWMSEHQEPYFDGVSYEVTPIDKPKKRCPIARHHPDCDCGGEGGDR